MRPALRSGARAASLAAILTLAALPAIADDEVNPQDQTPWRMVLQQQIKQVKSCDLNEVLTMQEFTLGDDKVIEGRVSCIDGREFTFTRRRPHSPFEFQLCEPTVC